MYVPLKDFYNLALRIGASTVSSRIDQHAAGEVQLDACEKVMVGDLRTWVCRSYCDEDEGVNAGMETCFNDVYI